MLETVLLVDDDDTLRESLSLVLSKNYEVIDFSSASEAISYLSTNELPVIALLDYMTVSYTHLTLPTILLV